MAAPETEENRVNPVLRMLATSIVVVAGLAWTLAWALYPDADMYGGCGTPAVNVVRAAHGSFEVSCQHEGILHVAIGVVIGGLITWFGLVQLLMPVTTGQSARTVSLRRAALAVVAFVLVIAAVGIAGTVMYDSGSWVPNQGPEL